MVLEKGKTERLIVAFSPTDTPNKGHIWNSSAPNIATIDETGLVTAVSEGEAIITATALNGKKTTTCKVTIVDKIINVTGISLNTTKTTIAKGDSIKLEAIILPDIATDKNVVWSSKNNQIASVDKAGNVTAIMEGDVSITATSNDGRKTASCEITVVGKGIEISQPKVSAITSITALITGIAKPLGIKVDEVGICYSTSPSPTTTDNKVPLSGENISYTLNKLSPNTTYYVRIYAIVDNSPKYGDQTMFTTLPIITTNYFKPIAFHDNYSSCGIELISPMQNGNNSVNVCFGTSPNPKITDNITTATPKDGYLLLKLSKLHNGTTYYIRTYEESGSKIEYRDDEVSVQTIGGSDFSITYSWIGFAGQEPSTGEYKINYNITPKGLYQVKALSTYPILFHSNNPDGEHSSSCYIESGKGCFYIQTKGYWTGEGDGIPLPMRYHIDFRIINTQTNIEYTYMRTDVEMYK